MESQKSFYVTDWLDKRAKLSPNRVGVYDAINDRELTYRQWNAVANQTANFLRSLGVQKGDRVSVYATNCLEYLDILFACGKIGAIQHNMNWRLTVNELVGIVNDAAPDVLIYSADWRDQVNQLIPQIPSVKHYVALTEKAQPEHLSFNERQNFPDTLDDRPEQLPDEPWAIYYTGGTTGLPKGAIMTHANAAWNCVNTVTSWGITSDIVAMLQLPLFHIGGAHIFCMPGVHVGGKTIVCKEFDIEQTYDMIDNAGITHFIGVPTMYLMMQQHPRWETADFSRLKLVISGGAPCPMPIVEKFWKRGIDFKTGYGLTEAPANNFWLPAEDVRRKPGSVGFPIFHIDMKIVTPEGTICAADEPGELLIRGPHVIPGYWNRPEATQESIVDGWLHTGDLARRDSEGYFYIIGRSKDMIISGGENVYPAEVESIMHAHPAVADAALIGVPDEKWGEVGRAVIALKPGQSLTEAELLNFMRERLAKYKLPKSVIFLPELPKTAIGKLDKKVLVKDYGK